LGSTKLDPDVSRIRRGEADLVGSAVVEPGGMPQSLPANDATPDFVGQRVPLGRDFPVALSPVDGTLFQACTKLSPISGRALDQLVEKAATAPFGAIRLRSRAASLESVMLMRRFIEGCEGRSRPFAALLLLGALATVPSQMIAAGFPPCRVDGFGGGRQALSQQRVDQRHVQGGSVRFHCLPSSLAVRRHGSSIDGADSDTTRDRVDVE